MKKILAIAAVAALSAGVSAYAANPFSDVSTSDWAYQAVSDLSDQGIVEGYPDGTFKGERNITRYELAQIIARLMAKEDQLNAEQQATINKLASEYADELANLGVRVSNLEKKVGNISWSGDARMRYQNKSYGADGYNGRLRINVKGQVNDSTYVQGRLTSNMDFKGNNSANTAMDTLFVNHNFSKNVAVRLGRQPIVFGNQGGWLYGDSNGYDGAQISAKFGKIDVTTGYGQINASNIKGQKAADYGGAEIFDEDAAAPNALTTDFYFAKANADFGVAKLDLNYITTKDFGKDDQELMGAGLVVPVQDFRVFGEYWKNTTIDEFNKAWNAGIGYGKVNLKKPGTFAIDVAYNDVEVGTFFGGTGLQTDVFNYLGVGVLKAPVYDPDGTLKTAGVVGGAGELKFWNVIADVVVQKNVTLHGEYAFNVKADDEKQDSAWTVSLNYKF